MKTMKTTLSLEQDVLKAVKQLAQRQHLTLGEVASGLLRGALAPEQKRASRRQRAASARPRARA